MKSGCARKLRLQQSNKKNKFEFERDSLWKAKLFIFFLTENSLRREKKSTVLQRKGKNSVKLWMVTPQRGIFFGRRFFACCVRKKKSAQTKKKKKKSNTNKNNNQNTQTSRETKRATYQSVSQKRTERAKKRNVELRVPPPFVRFFCLVNFWLMFLVDQLKQNGEGRQNSVHKRSNRCFFFCSCQAYSALRTVSWEKIYREDIAPHTHSQNL